MNLKTQCQWSRDRNSWIVAFFLAAFASGCTTFRAPHTVTAKYSLTATGQNDGFTEETEALSPDELLAAGGTAGDVFRGTDRRNAKTSIADADVEEFATIRLLRQTLPSDAEMKALGISKEPNSGRVDEETRNVEVSAYLFAVKKEDDQDFHLIVGDQGCHSPGCFLNVEVSGWPKSTQHPDRHALMAAREAFIDYFEGDDPGTTSGYDVSSPPIAVKITGSLFFDVDHSAGTVGPQGYRPNTAWEIHPVSDIEFP